MLQKIVDGAMGRCPECGRGALFRGYLSLNDHCENCGTSFAFEDAGDGPAVFVIMLVGLVSVVGALTTEVLYQPPYWVTGAIWVSVTVVLALVTLRPLKGILITLQYKNAASEGRLK